MHGGIKIMQKTGIQISNYNRSWEVTKLLDSINSVEARLRFVGRLIDERELITKDDVELMQELFNFVSEQIQFEVTLLKQFN